MIRQSVWAGLVCGLLCTPVAAQSREEKVRSDRQRVEADGFWIYNDLARGMDEARRTGKPLLVVLRCVPCEECVKLDEEVLQNDRELRPLLEKFVRVRVVSTNGLDLRLFQFDTDQSYAAFLLNADGTIYGRFGTRSHRTAWEDDVSMAGFSRALEGALELHARYPANRRELAAKTGPPPEVKSPEQFPRLKERYGSHLDYAGNVVKSCIHCHQIGDALRQSYRDKKEQIPEQVLFSYPHPKSLGLILDPRERATVTRVEPDTPAASAGFEPGDKILSLAGQSVLSLADVQWVLHHTEAQGAELAAQVERGSERKSIVWKLPAVWRRRDDLSWRASSWELRRMALGGLLLRNADAEERSAQGVDAQGMALFVEHVGQYAPHDIAKRAGVLAGDLIVAFDGKTNLRRETDLMTYALTERQVGDEVSVTIVRKGRKQKLSFQMQP
ncbi:MAG: Trx7/PDZ domain-containing (seleno)protein [Planctomycetales bacterium]